MISFRCERSKRRNATVTMRPTLLRAVRGQRLRDEGGPVICAALRAQASTAYQPEGSNYSHVGLDQLRRVRPCCQCLEIMLARQGVHVSPLAALWAIDKGKGRPGSVAQVCRTCLPELRDAMVGYGRRVMEAGRVGLELPCSEVGRPVQVLARIIALPPGEPVPKELHRDPVGAEYLSNQVTPRVGTRE